MNTMTDDTTITAQCDICLGTGTDEAFASTCGRCMGTGRVARGRTLVADRFRGDIAGAPQAPRPARTGWTRPTTARTAPARPGTPNLYPGTCTRCGRNVPAQAGTRSRNVKGGWDVAHTTCPMNEPIAPKPQAPTTAHPQAPTADVADGRYAIDTPEGVRFYRVRHGKNDWAGVVFVDVQHSDDYSPVKNRAAKAAIIAQIAQDPTTAMLRYGQEIGACGHCGRTLTDADSRTFGAGPVCRAKLGW